MEEVCTSETSVDNYFTRQYIPEDNSEQIEVVCKNRDCRKIMVQRMKCKVGYDV
jgi:hypothetical protein